MNYKTQNLINSARPAEVEKYNQFTFEETVKDFKNLTKKQLYELNFDINAGYKNAGCIMSDEDFSNGKIYAYGVQQQYKNLHNKAYSISNKFDGTGRWSPSRIFPTLRPINEQMFGKEKRVIFCKDADCYSKNLTDLKSYHKPPAQDNSRFIKALEDRIKKLIGDSFSNLSTCLLWIHIINNIIKPKNKPFIADNPSEDEKNKRNYYPERSDCYYNLDYLLQFPYNIKFTLTDLHIAYDNYFSGWLLDYIQNDYNGIKLIPQIVDNDGVVEKETMNAINKEFEDWRLKHINKYPLVIDEKYGSYSTVDTISQILSSVKMSSISPNHSGEIRYSSMAGRCAQKIYRYDPLGYAPSGDIFYVSIKEFARLFASAIDEIFTMDIGIDFSEEYNMSVATNAIMDNWIVCFPNMPDDNKTIAQVEEAELAKRGYAVNSELSERNKNDMRSVLRGGVNDIADSMIYGLNDYNWSMNIQELKEMGLTVDDFQHLQVWEFQPDLNISYKRMSDGLIDTFSKVTDVVGNGIIGSTASTGIQAVVNAYSKDINEIRQYSTNVTWVDQLLSGYYVSRFDIPYFGSRFLSSDTTEGWSMGNLLSNNEFLVNDLTLNVQDIPTWKYTPGQTEELTVDFYLLNKNIKDTINNMKFLFSFAAGAYWIQTSAIGYRSPNLYRIFCPGRFLMLYAAMGINIEFVGKVRRYSSEDAEIMFGNATGFAPLNIMIRRSHSCNIPEAYKISVKFKDLTPNAFNIPAAYFTDTEQTNTKDENNNPMTNNIFPNINTQIVRRDVVKQTMKKLQNEVDSSSIGTGLKLMGINIKPD